jgi:proteasome accessory factor B
VIGYDEGRKARRTFALQRMKAVRVMKTKFLRPADFDLKEHLGGSFGVWHNPGDTGKRQRIRLRFTGWAARMVSERRWHPSQETKWIGKKEDTLEMVMDLNSFEEISRWILSWGPQVEVMEPNVLKDAITGALRETLTHYS